jgi:predicted helicase
LSKCLTENFALSRSENKNILISVTNHVQIPFLVQATNCIPSLDVGGRPGQCLPLYRYDQEGNRLENITDWGLSQFQSHYQDQTITKENIFHYVYAVLHNPDYRQKYEQNLKRDFPRIPFYDDCFQWVEWGQKLMDLHINYETIEPYPLKRVDIAVDPPLTPLKKGEVHSVKTKLKADKIANKIILDDITTLENIPQIAWEYKLGNRSALEWILDQYKEKKPKDPTIAEKFNTYKFADYKEQVIDLLTRICTVSVKTMQIIQVMEKLDPA